MTDSNARDDSPPALLVDTLDAWAQQGPDMPALVFLEDGQTESDRLSRAELQRRAKCLSAALRDRQLVGERVLLAFHSSPDYVVSLLACMYAGVIAVPVYPPRQNWHARRLNAVARDAGARIVLTSDALRDEVHQRLSVQPADAAQGGADTPAVQTLAIGSLLPPAGSPAEAAAATWVNRDVDPTGLAYLQYTSGSTGDPKGVMVSQANLLHNTTFDARATGFDDASGQAFVSWLPIYHDMGLVMGIMLPLVLGATAVFMPPAAFVQQPINWLRAIERYRGSFSAAPNFAYDLCVSRIDAPQAAALDLSSWQVAINGAEPLWAPTLDAFHERFASSGVRPSLTSGAYGMAEATLAATVGGRDEVAPRLRVAKAALESDRVVLVDGDAATAATTLTLVSSGHVRPGFDVCIVDPHRGTARAPAQVGEIWLHGPSVAGGYWQRAQETAETFEAHLVDAESGSTQRRWLRTGDLGFVHDGQLYVTGRLKDLVIVRGANHYPQDLERTAEVAHPALRVGGFGAAFTVGGVDRHDRLVLVQEVDRTARRHVDVAEVGRAVADAITREHGIDVDMVVFVPPATVPKTSSGKVQRRACRDAVAANAWSEIGRWHRAAEAAEGVPAAPEDLGRWLQQCVARLAGRAAADIDTARPLLEQGLDSIRLVELTARTGAMMGRALAPTLTFDHPSIDALVRHLGPHAPGTPVVPETGRADAGAVEPAVPIAIIGMGCRLPGASGPQAFWDLLCSNRSPVREVSAERARLTGWHAAADAAHRHVGQIDAVDRFDAAAFGISPREARAMDPQQRLLLETAWQALEHAQLAPDRLVGSATGVFVGISSNDYYRLQRAHGHGLEAHAGTGGALSIAANRLSYVFGLQGPSLAIDTACSSSLVALHQACASLASGECTLALAGGVNLVLCDDLGTVFERAGMLAPDGRCKTFDAAANGYVRGEGCGLLVLKRLDHALRDGDAVLAVVSGSAVNQDGASNGLTAPNGLAQQQVVRRALQRAGIEGDAIDLVEAHGTGTPLGDPIEVAALRAVLDVRTDTPREGPAPCWLGAVKTRIGHLEAAAGVAGVIKTVLSLNHGVIPANAHFVALNPAIDLEGSRLQPASHPVVWAAHRDRPRRAGVSSFGFGGTNAHVVIEELRAVPTPAVPAAAPAPARCTLHPLSAATPAALRALAGAHARALEQARDADEAVRLSRAAKTGRATLSERLVLSASDPGLLVEGLHAYATGAAWPAGLAHSAGSGNQRPRLAFLFTGQGAQYVGMGAGLMVSEPVFRLAIERCDAVLQPLLGCSVQELLFGTADAARLADTRCAQPALAALQLALVALWAHRGVRPDLVCGHSVGEYAAAVCAGLMDEATALRLVAARSRLMSELPHRGAMLSVATDEAQARAAVASLVPALDLAARNGLRQTVWSGEESVVIDALALLRAKGLMATRLAVSHAFHSRLMEPMLGAFGQHLDGVAFGIPTAQIVPTGGSVDRDMNRADYWVNQIREPVVFADALLQLKARGVGACIEIGPGSTLLSLARQTIGEGVHIASLGGAMHDATEQMHAALGAWWAAGGAPRLDRLPDRRDPARSGRAVNLPVRVFEDVRHWFDQGQATAAAPTASAPSSTPLAGHSVGLALRPVPLADAGLRVFDTVLAGHALDTLRDHVVAGRAVMPAAGWVALAWAAARRVAPGLPSELTALQFEQPLLLDGEPRVQSVLSRAESHRDIGWTLRIARPQHDGSHWVDCMTGTLGIGPASAPAGLSERVSATDDACDPWTAQSTTAFYATWASRGLAWGPAFRLVTHLATRGDDIRATLAMPTGGMALGEALNPAWLDAAFQCVGALLTDRAAAQRRVPVPVRIARVWAAPEWPASDCQLRARVRALGDDGIEADLSIIDADGKVRVAVQGLALRWVDALAQSDGAGTAVRSGAVADAPLAAFEPRWEALPAHAPAGAPRHWCIVGADPEQARQLSASLQQAGLNVSALAPALAEHRDAVRAWNAARPAGQPVGLLVVPQVAARDCGDVDEAALMQGIAMCRTLQGLLLALDDGVEGTADRRARLCLLSSPGDSLDAALRALWRSAALELPGFEFQCGDIGTGGVADPTTARLVVQALAGESRAWRVHAGALWAPGWQRVPDAPQPVLPIDGGVLITGGLGALGWQLAERLVARGQRRLWLSSRQARPTALQQAQIVRWRAQGCAVETVACNLAVRADVQRLIDVAHTPAHPLCGVVHAAGATADAALTSLGENHWHTVLAGKVWGALWLSELTRDLPLHFFVAYSSAAAPLGSAGQCNYAAANGLLESIVADARGAAGCRRVALQWGPWQGAGMAQAVAAGDGLAQRGIGLLDGPGALDAFELALAGTAPALLIGRYDWARAAPREFGVVGPTAAAERPTLQQVVALPAAARQSLIRHEFGVQLAQVLGVAPTTWAAQDGAAFDQLRLATLGLDSLMAMEIRNHLRSWLGVDLPAHLLIGNHQVGDALALVHQKLLLRSLSEAVDGDDGNREAMEVEVL